METSGLLSLLEGESNVEALLMSYFGKFHKEMNCTSLQSIKLMETALKGFDQVRAKIDPAQNKEELYKAFSIYLFLRGVKRGELQVVYVR